MSVLRWLRARRQARLDAEIDAAFVEAWAVIVEQRIAKHDELIPTTR